MSDNTLYTEWIETSLAEFMQDENFFIGSGDSTVDLFIRESAYDYIKNVFGNRRISLSNPYVWSDLYKAALTEVGNNFWRLLDAEKTSRVADLVTADYVEEVRAFSTSAAKQVGKQTGTSSSTQTSHAAGKSNQDAITQTTSGDRASGAVTTEDKQISPARTVQLNSNLAESTYVGVQDVPGEGTVLPDGVPLIDTSHGDTASGAWSTTGHKTSTVTVGAPTGEDKTTTSPINSQYEDVSAGGNSSSYGSGDIRDSINDNINGSRRAGSRDFNGYNLTASVQAILGTTPYIYLRQSLGRCFSAF